MSRPPVERFAVWSRLNVFHKRVAVASAAIAEWLVRAKNPYISFSGGKDSTALLHLVRELSPSTPAIYFDAQCAFPEVDALIDSTPSVTRWPADEPFMETIARHGLHGGGALERATMESTVWGPVKRLLEANGFDGMAYGLRAAESIGRKRLAMARGPLFWHKRDSLWACQPLAHWSYDDVWAYIFSRQVAYCRTYDRMWDMPEREQRISYWAGETNRANGRYAWLKRNYPDLWNQLAVAIPDVRAYA